MKPLFNLVNKNKWNKIYDLIKKDNVYLSMTKNGNNILHIAALNNKIKILKYALINNKLSFMKKNSDGYSPIHLLAINGYNDTIKLLIKQDKGVANDINNDGRNILFYVLDDSNMFEWITQNSNVDINKIDNYETNLLIMNIKKTKKITDNYFKNIKTLVSNGVDLNKLSPLSHTIKYQKNHVFDYLIELKKNGYSLDVNAKKNDYITPLLTALDRNQYNIVKTLVHHGADVNYTGPEGDLNPMFKAIFDGQDDAILLFLNKGYDMNIYNRNLDTALHIALFNKTNISSDTLFELIYHGYLNKKKY